MNLRPVVYVVDDEPALRELARRIIESMALDVECFSSGQQFLEQYDPSRVSCLLTDLKMPDMSGQQLLEVMAERRSLIPAIMISGHGDIPAAVRAMAIGAIAFLEKPCSLDALRDTIRRAVEMARKRHQGAAAENAVKDRIAALTDDERTTMQRIASGIPDKAIASQLDVSLRTVQYRRASLFEKLGVKNRAELIRLAPLDELASAAEAVSTSPGETAG
ncbi:MAG TPA: response regulator [Pirellulales bacterium]|nr:response regulator [Pirellulales bacterium]